MAAVGNTVRTKRNTKITPRAPRYRRYRRGRGRLNGSKRDSGRYRTYVVAGVGLTGKGQKWDQTANGIEKVKKKKA